MKISLVYLAVTAALLPDIAIAADPVDLGSIAVIDQAAQKTENGADAAYESYDPVDTGLSVINRQSIQHSNSGGIDTTELLKVMPFVQMDVERNEVKAENEQNIRPSDFSISGGNYYENNIMIDGVGANSIMDVTGNTASNFNEVSGRTSQSIYIDPNLLESIEVLDSNISAEHGGFIGGVVNYKLRKPKRVFGFDFSAGYQNDSMINYIHDDESEEDTEDNAPPSFEKYNSSITFDLPITEKLAIMTSYSRSKSTVDYLLSEKYGGDSFTNSDVSENFIVKGIYDFNEDIVVEGGVTYSPYTSGYRNSNGINNQIETNSGGFSSFLQAYGETGQWNWDSKLSYSDNDTSRKAPSANYSWDSDSDYSNWCSSSNCTEGGFGNIDSNQRDFALSFNADTQLAGGVFRVGTELRTTTAEQIRPNDNYAYSSGEVLSENGWDSLNCIENDPACIEDDIILLTHQYYKGYDASATVNTQSVWLEYQRQFGDVDLRGGLRYDHDDFLDNHTLAPRLTAAWQFMENGSFTVGANRYYDGGNVSYAIREQYPDSYTFKRMVDGSGNVITADDTDDYGWYLSKHSKSTSYSTSDLDTPYADELTAAFTFNTPLDGNLRLKGIFRKAQNKFVKNGKEKVEYNKETGGTSSHTVYSLTNDGETEYKGVSLEWSGRYENHFFNANATWSETVDVGGVSDFDSSFDPVEDDFDFVYYDGRIISMSEVYDISGRQNYAAPIKLSASWGANWLSDRLTTYVSVHYRGEYQALSDTNDNIDIDNEAYDIYAEVTRKAYTEVDLNVSYKVLDSANHNATIEAKVNNLFEALPHTDTSSSNPYQKGRSFWVYLKYNY
ncbi:TonB-dependent receptor plug domain-containing protein [Shewanella sp. A14]